MKVLVTGYKGFVGKNFVCALENNGIEVLGYDIDTSIELLGKYAECCDYVFHFAGVNRPKEQDEFVKGNTDFTKTLIDALKKHKNNAPLIMTSSIQASLDNPYGISKKAAEDVVFEYGEETGIKTCVYRLPNVFGKWCRPNYNSVVATFCNNIANGLPININDETTELNLVYIDDVVQELMRVFDGRETRGERFCFVPLSHKIKLGELAQLIYSFKEGRGKLNVADMSDQLTKKLYSTYLSYLPENGFSYPLKMNVDARGSFTEIIKTSDRGQFSVNIIKPGIVKGNHWHNTKNEKFLVVKGKGVIRFRNVFSENIITYEVNDGKYEVVDIPVGYTHNIENLSKNEDMVVFMWCNEMYDKDNPDTYFLEV